MIQATGPLGFKCVIVEDGKPYPWLSIHPNIFMRERGLEELKAVQDGCLGRDCYDGYRYNEQFELTAIGVMGQSIRKLHPTCPLGIHATYNIERAAAYQRVSMGVGNGDGVVLAEAWGDISLSAEGWISTGVTLIAQIDGLDICKEQRIKGLPLLPKEDAISIVLEHNKRFRKEG